MDSKRKSRSEPKKSRIVAIDLDDQTDSGSDDDNSETLTIRSGRSLDLSSELSQYSDLNRSASDLEIDLIEEVINEDTEQMAGVVEDDQMDDSDVELIKGYLKSDSDDCIPPKLPNKSKKSKKSEKSKSKRKLINKLVEENLHLFRLITDLNKELEQKAKEVEVAVRNRPRILCFTCSSGAVEEFFCCFNGCYCSEECQVIDWFTNKHFEQCLRLKDQSPSNSQITLSSVPKIID